MDERENGQDNLAYVIKRMGFADPSQIKCIAESISSASVWEDRDRKVAYLCIGAQRNHKLPHIRQILFKDIARFFVRRFSAHPMKIPKTEDSLRLWGDFGSKLAQWFQKNVWPQCPDQPGIDEKLKTAIERYISGLEMEIKPNKLTTQSIKSVRNFTPPASRAP